MTQAAKGQTPDTSRFRKWLRRLAPWVVSAATVAFILSRYSFTDIGAAAVRGDWPWLLPWAAAAAIGSLLFMGTADWQVVKASLGSISWWKMLRGKAGTSVVIAFNHSVGQGIYGVWIARSAGAEAWKTLGIILYIMLSDLTALCVVATIAIFGLSSIGPTRVGMVTWLAPAAATGLALCALFGPKFLPRWVSNPRLVSPWAAVQPLQYATSLVLRICAVGSGMIATWAAAQMFGLDIPFDVMLATLPVIYLVGALPINVAGLGPVQLVWLGFYRPYADGPDIIAFQVLFHLAISIMLVARGAPFIKMVTDEVARGKDGAITEDPAQADAATSDSTAG